MRLFYLFLSTGMCECVCVTWIFPSVCLRTALATSQWLKDLGELDGLGLVMCSSPYGFWGRWLELLLRGISDPGTFRWPEGVADVEMGDMLKCLPAVPFPMHEFLKELLLFRSSMERQNSLVGADQQGERKKKSGWTFNTNTDLKKIQKYQDHNPLD